MPYPGQGQGLHIHGLSPKVGAKRVIRVSRQEEKEMMMKVWIDENCIACGTCVELCPEVFELEGEIASLKSGADFSLDDKIIEAAEACPVEAIHYEK
jgi:ferredoxin